ncbi:MAG TPA: O-antigen ligase family protein [Anaerolineae bacterium]|nr:O-antigen ligase family protein [Anaerolineae bacterium]
MSKTPSLESRPLAPKAALGVVIVILGAALAVLPIKWAALLLIGSIAGVGDLIRPALTLCLLPFAVPFGSLREVTLGPISVGGAELLLAVLVGTWLAQSVSRRRIVVPRAPLMLPLAIFLAALLLSVLAATSLELSGKEIVKWVEVMLIYGLVAQETDDRLGRWIVWAMLAAASAEAALGIYQFLFRVGPEGFVLFGRFMRSYGHFAQPNPFAGYLGLCFPLAYALSLDSLPRLARVLRGHASQLPAALLPLAAAAVTGAAMLTSWSRGAWVGLAASVATVTLLRSRRALLLSGVAGVCLALVLAMGGGRFIPAALVQRTADLIPLASGVDLAHVEVNDANWAILERMAHWQAAAAMFNDHPWLGVGTGNYPVAYPRYAVGRWRDPLGHAHNYYLNVAAEAGLVGFVAYVLLVTACLLEAWRVIRRTRGTGWWNAVALGVLGILVHLSVHNLFDNLYVHSMNVQLGLALGLLALADRYGRPSVEPPAAGGGQPEQVTPCA